MSLLAALCLMLQNDAAQANGRDNAWENAWVAHSRTVYTRTSISKVDGKVIHVGDSITFSSAYKQWPVNGANRSAEDNAIRSWCKADLGTPGSITPTDPNGFYLCTVDIVPQPQTVPASPSYRSMTAAGGISTNEYLAGTGNGGTAMPSTATTGTAQTYVSDYAYTHDLHITTVASAFLDARFAVVMLGTNDIGASRQVGAFIADLGAIVAALEARDIVVILSTIPPRTGSDVTAYNDAIRNLAQTVGLPLIDYYAEILARRPGTSWQGTLIGADGIHPTGANPAADAYVGGSGDITAHRTGTNATTDGYLLRGWLTMQKLKEVRAYVVQGVNPPGWVPPGGGGPPAGGGTPGGNREESGCSGSIQGNGAWAFALAGALLGLAFVRGVAR